MRKTSWDEKEKEAVGVRASTSPYSCCMDVDSAVVIEGGGPASDHGGSRNKAGRKAGGRKDYNWSKYKPMGKKEQKKFVKSNFNIKDLFSKQTKNSESKTLPTVLTK